MIPKIHSKWSDLYISPEAMIDIINWGLRKTKKQFIKKKPRLL